MDIEGKHEKNKIECKMLNICLFNNNFKMHDIWTLI